ncbi:MAG: EamA family transporter [Planctomycetes bacterium]|nr:EamA family transporter [Planctomycetota bacterium]
MATDPADETPPPPPSSWAIALAFGIVFFSWGTTYLATSIAMKEEHTPPGLFGGFRLLTAGTILLVWQYALGQSLRLNAGEYLCLFVVSAFLFLSSNFLISYGQKKVESSVAAILIATTPLWMGLFAMAWPGGERLSWRGWLGLAIGFAGILLTKLDGEFNFFDDFYALLILASAASWAMGSLVSRHMALTVPHLTSAGFQMLFGGISQISLGSAIGEWGDLPPTLTPGAVWAFLYLLVYGSLLGFVAFNWLLGHVAASKVGTYAYVNPTIAVFIGSCAGESVHVGILAGIAVILVGVYLVRGDHAPSKEIEVEPD